jgi:hypothetical protein
MWLAGALVFMDVLPTILSILDHFTHECAYYYYLYPYECAAVGEYSTLPYFHPLQQSTIQSKLERRYHKTERVSKCCRSSLGFNWANVFHVSINLGLLGEKLMYYICNPDWRYELSYQELLPQMFVIIYEKTCVVTAPFELAFLFWNAYLASPCPPLPGVVVQMNSGHWDPIEVKNITHNLTHVPLSKAMATFISFFTSSTINEFWHGSLPTL